MWYSLGRISWIMFIRYHRLNKNIKIGFLIFIIYLINRFILKNINVPYLDYFLDNHFNDFLGGTLFCCYVNSILIINGKKAINNFLVIIISMFLVSLAWEFIFPVFLKYSTSDWIDVIFYMLGTILYCVLFYDYNKRYNNVIKNESHSKSTN